MGPRSSRFERLWQISILGTADYGSRRIPALTGLARIADCTLGTWPCKDHSLWAALFGFYARHLKFNRWG
eukprot:8954646-Alexandrium_andersonii.AAC.1